MKNIKVYFCIAAAALALSSLAGCSKDPAKVVPQRASERWNLLINHEAIKAYEYLSPGYRATHTLDQYVAFVATTKFQWKEAKVESSSCDADTCSVKLVVKSLIPGALTKTPHDVESESPVTEQWILNEGQWYFVPDSFMPDAKGKSGAGEPPTSAQRADATPASSPDAPGTGSDKAERKP